MCLYLFIKELLLLSMIVAVVLSSPVVSPSVGEAKLEESQDLESSEFMFNPYIHPPYGYPLPVGVAVPVPVPVPAPVPVVPVPVLLH